MEYQEDSLDFENLVFTPTDWESPMSPPPLPLPLPLPLPPSSSHIHMSDQDVAPSSAQDAGKKRLEQEEFELPDLTCIPTPTDGELVWNYLRPAIQRMQPEEPTSFMDPFRRQRGPGVVNSHLPFMDPWELPGIIAGNNKGKGKGGMMRHDYYLTDHTAVAFFHSFDGVRTTNGVWQKHKKRPDMGIMSEDNKRVAGIKRTMKFHPYTRAETNWTMNVYSSLNERNSFIQDGLVLCHVFETHSAPEYNDNPKCLGCHRQECSGHHHDQEFGAPSKYTSFSKTQPELEYWTIPYDPELDSIERLMSCIEQSGNPLLSDTVSYPDNSVDAENSGARRGDPPTADHGLTKKRKKISDVWDYFTKIFARDINGKVVTYAACNHCCNIMSANSKNGTSPLARHACPCKFKPVAAGRNAKDSGGDVNVLWP